MSVERTAADWDVLTREYGRVCGDLITWQRVAEERAAELQDVRAQLAPSQDQLQKPPNDQWEAGP